MRKGRTNKTLCPPHIQLGLCVFFRLKYVKVSHPRNDHHLDGNRVYGLTIEYYKVHLYFVGTQ